MNITDLKTRKPVQPTTIDPVPSQRAVISEAEIFQQKCPFCSAIVNRPCRNTDGTPIAWELDSTELAFHPQRIIQALHAQVTTKMKGVLSPADRSLIVYYAFIMLCDASAANSDKLFGKKYTSEDLQAFFAQTAITELLKDRLIPPPKVNSSILQ